MVIIDVGKVKGKMTERGYTTKSMAEKLGIDRNTLAAYFKNPEKTPYHVVASLANELCDTTEEASSIFFKSDLRAT